MAARRRGSAFTPQRNDMDGLSEHEAALRRRFMLADVDCMPVNLPLLPPNQQSLDPNLCGVLFVMLISTGAW